MRPDHRELTTDRLVLRRPRQGDAPAIFASFGADPEVTRFLAWRPHESIADAEAALSARLERLARGVEYSWMIELSATRRLVGVVSAWIEGGAAELGFALARSHWGQGIATEAVLAVRDWALSSPAVSRVWATCDLENRASARVLRKAGFAARGLFDREIVRPNLEPRPRPSLLFEIVRRAGSPGGGAWAAGSDRPAGVVASPRSRGREASPEGRKRMATWAEFSASAPEIARLGERRLFQFGPGLAFLATVRADGGPRVHPVCVNLVAGEAYLLIGPSPKRGDLLRDGRFALHSFPGPDSDDEFYLTGVATREPDPGIVERVAAAQIARGATTSANELAFRLGIERVLYARYKPRGEPDNWPPEYLKWPAPRRGA